MGAEAFPGFHDGIAWVIGQPQGCEILLTPFTIHLQIETACPVDRRVVVVLGKIEIRCNASMAAVAVWKQVGSGPSGDETVLLPREV